MDPGKTIFFSFFLLFSCSNAFNITEMLSQFKDFSTFNDLLSQTQVAGDINTRQTITILAVSNSALSPLSGQPIDIVKKILSVHVILDYYDLEKLRKMQNKSATLTTLFQSSGQATGQQGFLTVNLTTSGGVVLGSQASGSSAGSNVVKMVVSQPYNVSVLQISNAIVPMGIDAKPNNSTSPPHHSPVPAPGSGKMAPPSRSPVKAPGAAPPKSGRAPAPSDGMADAPAPTAAPGTPTAAPGTPPVPTNETGGDAPAADTEKPKSKSAAVALGISAGRIFMIIASLISSLVLFV